MVVDSEELMDHRLVGPLVQERSHGVISAIEEEENRGNVRCEGKQVVLSLHGSL